MKLRLQDDSLRLRLNVSEVRTIGSGAPVSAATRFPGGAVLTYELVPSGVAALSAGFADGRVTVEVPHGDAQAWAASESWISLEGTVDLGATGILSLLVEKDFACLAPRPGDDSADLFVNPRTRNGP